MIEVFADVSCPFTHVGLRRLVDRRTELVSTERIHVKAWPLELVNGEPLAASFVADEVTALREQVAPDLFEHFDPATFPATTLPALRLAAAAYRLDLHTGERMSLALRHALFEEGRDISSPEVLDELACAHGVASDDRDDAIVIAEWQEGQRRGVQGSPYFFTNGQGFFCPSLEISRVGDHLEVRPDNGELDRFLAAAFG